MLGVEPAEFAQSHNQRLQHVQIVQSQFAGPAEQR